MHGQVRNTHPTPNGRPQCSRLIAIIRNGVNQKILFFQTAFQYMIRTYEQMLLRLCGSLALKNRQIIGRRHVFHILELDVTLV
jgi:hypothetical protein